MGAGVLVCPTLSQTGADNSGWFFSTPIRNPAFSVVVVVVVVNSGDKSGCAELIPSSLTIAIGLDDSVQVALCSLNYCALCSLDCFRI